MLTDDIQKCEELIKKEYARVPLFWVRIKKAALESCQLSTTKVKSSADATATHICSEDKGFVRVNTAGVGVN